jgi:DNA mismatch repair ATPase MutS
MDAVEEIISSSSEKLVVLRQVLKKLPDLAKGLCRIHYGKVGYQALLHLLVACSDMLFCAVYSSGTCHSSTRLQ